MRQLLREIDANFAAFSTSWDDQLTTTKLELSQHGDLFRESYRRIVSLQAWRTEILMGAMSEGSLAFFLEAQNDALVSHTLAQFGAWRSALKALRSSLENIVWAVYYADHPVELRLWELGKQRIGFAPGIAYLRAHPDIRDVPENLTGVGIVEKEYGTLSRAVHASAKSFRMTHDAAGTRLWSSAAASVRAWSTRERMVLTGLNLLLLALHRDRLAGTRQPNLRKAISLVVRSRHQQLRRSFGVSLYALPAS